LYLRLLVVAGYVTEAAKPNGQNDSFDKLKRKIGKNFLMADPSGFHGKKRIWRRGLPM
jgi:hypothetical protein